MKKCVAGFLVLMILIGSVRFRSETILTDAFEKGKNFDEVTILHVDAGKQGFAEFVAQAEEMLEIHIHVVECPDNADNRQAMISTILSSGDDSVDIITVNDEMISEFKYKDCLVPLEKEVMTESVQEAYPKEYLENICMANGSIYSVPYLMDILLFWVNQELLRQAGLDEITDYNDLLKLSRNLPEGKYAYGDAWEKTYIYNAVSEFIGFWGGDYKNWSDEHTREAVSFLKQLVEQGVTSTEQMVDYHEQMEEKFIEGRYASLFMYSGAISIFSEAGVYGEDRIHIADIPSFGEQTTNIATWQYVLNNASPNKEAALKFLKYAASPQGSLNYAKIMKSMPARLDVVEDEKLDIEGINEVRQYLRKTRLCARPMCVDSMAAISVLGTLFQEYILGEIGEETLCTEAQKAIQQYYTSEPYANDENHG